MSFLSRLEDTNGFSPAPEKQQFDCDSNQKFHILNACFCLVCVLLLPLGMYNWHYHVIIPSKSFLVCQRWQGLNIYKVALLYMKIHGVFILINFKITTDYLNDCPSEITEWDGTLCIVPSLIQ